MSHYYEEDDLERFGEIGKYRPELFDIFMNYYQSVMSAGTLTVREKALIALAVAHAVQCPYCIDAYTRGSLEAGSNLDEMTEAIHVAAAIRGGATLIHGIQAHNVAAKVSI
jgi:alkylhydroperoxidase/carboxymuconolactone decarboxylase family protein